MKIQMYYKLKNGLGDIFSWIKTRVDRIWAGFKKQWKGQWVVIIIEIGIASGVFYLGNSFVQSLHDSDVTQKTTPLFKYTYDKTDDVIKVDSGDDFSPVTIMWLIPEIFTATSTVKTQNDFPIQDIVKWTIMDNLHYLLEKTNNPFSDNFEAYFKCIVLNSFGLESSGFLEGFPIGVEIRYIVRGDATIKSNYDLLKLRRFDISPLQIHSFPNVSGTDLKNVLLEKGNYRFKQIVEKTSYDENNTYMNKDGTCRQTTEPFSKIPLK